MALKKEKKAKKLTPAPALFVREELTDEQVLQREFMRRFSTWNIPVEKLQITLETFTNEDRQQHYIELGEIISKKAFKREIEDWKRRVSRALAMGVLNGREIPELERKGLQILMIEIENFETTLHQRARLRTAPAPLRPIARRV